MKRRLKITLKSDLCAGSGYSYAGVIDSDACFDRYGIPYIPARRIKGCLREAAVMIGEDETIFGSRGQKSMEQENVFRISDAYPEDYRKVVSALENLKNSADFANYFSAEQIRQCFSRVKAQTEITDAGVANNNSLRFTRIVNHYDPSQKQEMCFLADVELADGDKNAERVLDRAAKALRHMGENRNRGLGNVRCELGEADDESGTVVIENEEKFQGAQPSDRFLLKYTVKTEAPIVISSESDAESETYIGGTSVMGAFAAVYLRRNGMEADASFEEMFLKNRMCFSPLYPSDAEGNVYVPAPSYIGKLKKSGELVNVSLAEFPKKEDAQYGLKAENGRYYPGDGNQPKKLKGKYVGFLNSGIAIKEVDMEVIYHHRHKSDNANEQLYALQAIQSGQFFAGTIIGEKEQIKEAVDTLKTNTLRFGKSRNAQYGACRVVKAEIQELESARAASDANHTCQAGDTLLVTFRTDGIFRDPETGNETVRLAEVRRQVGAALNESLGGDYLEISDDEAERAKLYAELEVGMLSGFYGVWNLRRESVPCVCAGSTFEFCVKQKLSLPENPVHPVQAGCRKGEGFGMLDIRERQDGWLLNGKGSKSGNDRKNGDDEKKDIPEILKAIYWKNVKAEIFTKMEQKALQVGKTKLSASAVGRLTLMLTESINKCKEEQKGQSVCADKVKEKLDERIASVKNNGKQDEMNGLVEQYFEDALNGWSTEEIRNRISDESIRKKLKDESVQKEIDDACKLYCLQQALVVLKYKKKEEN